MGERMREIKFRAWNGKELFSVDVLAISPCTWDCPDHGKRGVSLAYQPHIKVMQYTGLKDKNGLEIYEGDILEREIFAFEQYRTFIGEVKMFEGAWWIDSGTAAVQLWNEMHELTVIGNIYSNPKLLEEGK